MVTGGTNITQEHGEAEDPGSPTRRLERRWLGSLRIPFSTLYLNSKIEGTFCLNTPPMLLGYEHDSRSYGNLNRSTGTSSNGSLKNTYLTLFLTIDPTLQQPEPLALKVSVLLSLDEVEIEFSKSGFVLCYIVRFS